MLIGITGGIGSGKSTVAKALERLGYPVYDTDREAKRIIVENLVVRSQVELLFGSDIFDGDVYRTDRVAAQVFADRSLLDKLNRVVHPAVCFDLRHWAIRMEQQHPGRPCFAECAIIYESGIYKECTQIVEVTAPLETRIERTMKRDNASREAVERRIHSQMPDEERLARANIILRNDGSCDIDSLAKQLLEKLS